MTKKQPDDFELTVEDPAKPKEIAKPTYTESFETFWTAYPRKVAKPKAFQSWEKYVGEVHAAVVIADIEKRNRMRFWATDKSKIPMPTTYLNQGRWEDEWEDEVTTRGKETIATYTKHESRVPEYESPQHNQGPWMSLLQLLGRNYLFKCGGVTPAMCKMLLREKNAVFKELMPGIEEEIEGADDKQAAAAEMRQLLGDTLLTRFDMITGRALKSEVIKCEELQHA